MTHARSSFGNFVTARLAALPAHILWCLLAASVVTRVHALPQGTPPNTAQPETSGGDPHAAKQQTPTTPPGTGGDTEGDPVEVMTGAFVYSTPLLDIPGRGRDLKFELGYASNVFGLETQTGARWSHTFEEKIVLQYSWGSPLAPYRGPADVGGYWNELQNNPEMNEEEPITEVEPRPLHIELYHFHDLRIDTYQWDASDPTNWIPTSGQLTKLKSVNTYTPPYPYAMPTSFTLRYPNGSIVTFPNSLWESNCGVFTVRAQTMVDRNANTIAIEYESVPKTPGCTYGDNFFRRPISITDTMGRVVSLSYDAAGWLTQLDDFTGRKVDLEHDTFGNITAITKPSINTFPKHLSPAPATYRSRTEFEYTPFVTTAPHSKHNIARVYAPTEVEAGTVNPTLRVPFVDNTWDVTAERVVRQFNGGTNTSGVPAGGLHDFIYEPVASFSFGWFTCSGRMLTIDPNGYAELYYFDTSHRKRLVYQFTGGITHPSATAFPAISTIVSVNPFTPSTTDCIQAAFQSIAPLGSCEPPVGCTFTRFDYNSDNFCVKEITPDSISESVYDSGSPDRLQRGNLLVHTRVSNSNPSDVLRRAYIYEPLFNQVRVEYDERAFGSYTPPNGGTYTPERYSITSTFDYQEDSSAMGAALAAPWSIDLTQASSIAVLGGYGLTQSAVAFGSDANGNGVVDGHAGNVVRTERGVRVYNNAAVQPPTFQSLSEVNLARYNAFGLPTETIDAAGFATQYAYYPVGAGAVAPGASCSGADGGFVASVTRVVSITPSATVTTRMGYDAIGRTTLQRDPRGFDTTCEYDELDRCVTTIDALGTKQSTLYDANGNPVQSFAELIEPVMDATSGQPSSSTTASRFIEISRLYDIMDHVVAVSTPNKTGGPLSITQYRYDRAGQLVLTLSPEWGNDPQNCTSSVFDELGRAWTSSAGGITAQFQRLPANGDIPELGSLPVDVVNVTATSKLFYTNSKLTRSEDAAGFSEHYAHDGFNRRTSTTNRNGHETVCAYDVCGPTVDATSYQGTSSTGTVLRHTLSKLDERGQVFETIQDHFDSSGTPIGDGESSSRLVFDIRGLTIHAVNDSLDQSSMTYDGLGRCMTATDAEGNSVEHIYDACGNEIRTTSTNVESDSPSTTHVTRVWRFHDALGRLAASVDELGRASRVVYDSLSRVACTSDARATLIDVALSSLDSTTAPQHSSLPTMLVNRIGNTTWNAYDDSGRLVTTTIHQYVAGEGGNSHLAGAKAIIAKTCGYDLNGRLTSETDDLGKTSAYSYDSLNRRIQTQFADTTVSQCIYTLRNSFDVAVDANGTITQYTYDDNGQLRYENVTPATNVLGPVVSELQYDGLGRLVAGINANATVARTFDSLDQVETESLNGHITVFTHDGAGRLTSLEYPSGRILDRSVDAIGRLRAVEDHGASTPLAILEYRSSGVAKSRSLQNGVLASFSHDAVFRPTTQTDVLGTTAIVDRSVVWDRDDNKTSVTDNVPSSPITSTFAYDSASRLIGSRRVQSSITIESVDYRLDDAGSRRTVIGGADAGTYTLGTGDLPTGRYTTTPFDSRAYDAVGNLTTIASAAVLYYDYRNRLVKYEDTANTLEHRYEYDVFGRRTKKIVDYGGAGETVTDYYYDAQWNIIEERDATDATVATYVYEDGLDALVEMRRDVDADTVPDDVFYHSDEMGDVQAVSDGSGSVLEAYGYLDYGVPLDASRSPLTGSAVSNSRLFSGREYDWETGLYYFRNRYFDPRAGRFITRDPIGIWGDSTNIGNGYSYCGNNPGSRTDRVGLQTVEQSNIFTDSKRGDIANSRNGGDIKGNTTHWGSAPTKDVNPDGPVFYSRDGDGTQAPKVGEGKCEKKLKDVEEQRGRSAANGVAVVMLNAPAIQQILDALAEVNAYGAELERWDLTITVGISKPGVDATFVITVTEHGDVIVSYTDRQGGQAVLTFDVSTSDGQREFRECLYTARDQLQAQATTLKVSNIIKIVGLVGADTGILIATAGVGGAPAGAARVTAGTTGGSTILYRAVSQAEAASVRATGKFSAGPNSLGGKWFAETLEHAEQWGNAMNGKGVSRILEVKLPNSAASQLMRVGRLDGIGPARYGELGQLGQAVIRELP